MLSCRDLMISTARLCRAPNRLSPFTCHITIIQSLQVSLQVMCRDVHGNGIPIPNPWEWDHRCAKNRNGKSTRIRGFLNDMRHINPRFTYLLTYLLTSERRAKSVIVTGLTVSADTNDTVADAGFLQGGCGSWCLWNAPIPFMPSLPPTLKKISWEPAAR